MRTLCERVTRAAKLLGEWPVALGDAGMSALGWFVAVLSILARKLFVRGREADGQNHDGCYRKCWCAGEGHFSGTCADLCPPNKESFRQMTPETGIP